MEKAILGSYEYIPIMTNFEVSIFLKFIVENIFWNLKDGDIV